MKAISLACFAGLFLCAAASPVSARQEVVVQPGPSLAAWSATVGRRLDDGLRWPARIWSGGREEGVARVAFRCSEDGRPAEVALMRSSGVPEFDHEAMRAVRKIKTLHPLATGIGHDQRYAAVVSFGTSQASVDRQRARAMREDQSLAAISRGGGRLAMVGPIPANAQ